MGIQFTKCYYSVLYCTVLYTRARYLLMEYWIFFIFYLGLYFSYAFLYICSGIFQIFKKNDVWHCKNATENWVYPIETQILKFWVFWVVIHPELRIEILRPMEKDLAQSDLPVLSYGQKTANFCYEKCYFSAISPI